MAQHGQYTARSATTFCRWWACILLLAAGSAATAAEEQEVREFKIRIDNKPAGTYHMAITKHADGTEILKASAHVKVSYLVISYRYTLEETEVWKGGRLWKLDSSANDNGKKLTANAVAKDNELEVTANGETHRTRWDVWPTTYWHSPDKRFLDQVVPLLDADTGKDLQSTLKFAGTEQLTVAGQVQNCSHYTLRGDQEADLWYDAQGRLVREEAIEDGHKTLIELVGVQR
jgi:hypothetical protein